MKRLFALLAATLAGLVVIALWLSAGAGPAAAQEPEPPAARIVEAAATTGNYCLSCHTAGEVSAAAPLAWHGGAERLALERCPAQARLGEEHYYTLQLLQAIDRARGPAGADVLDARLVAGYEAYARQLDSPVRSLDAAVAEAFAQRYRLGQRYAELTRAGVARRQQTAFVVAGLVTLALAVTLAWGWRTARRHLPARLALLSRPSVRGVVVVGAVFVLFALPVFRTPATPAAELTVEELATLSALDTAQRQAATAERALARAWMLARVAAGWAALDPAQAEAGLAEALAAEASAQAGAQALWGAAQGAREAAIGSAAGLAEAELIAAELDSVRQRTWALRLIAAEWQAVDPPRALAIRELALAQTLARAPGRYRDLDLRGLAMDWASLDSGQALAVAGLIGDPGLRAWAFRGIAATTGSPAAFLAAAEAARSVAAPVERAQALAAVAAESHEPHLIAEAAAALAEAGGAAHAFGLSHLAAATGDARFASQIDSAFPAAQAAAWLGLGDYDQARAAAQRIVDPLERDRALAAIAGGWGNPDVARSIAHPIFRAAALRDVTLKTGDPSLPAEIELPYYRVLALAGLGRYAEAAEAAGALREPYPRLVLAEGLAATDPGAALALVESLDREADRAAVMRAVVGATLDEAAFERALSLALAARVRGDALAPAEASLALARGLGSARPDWAAQALAQAHSLAAAISLK